MLGFGDFDLDARQKLCGGSRDAANRNGSELGLCLRVIAANSGRLHARAQEEEGVRRDVDFSLQQEPGPAEGDYLFPARRHAHRYCICALGRRNYWLTPVDVDDAR
jgi:hypothetical protein